MHIYLLKVRYTISYNPPQSQSLSNDSMACTARENFIMLKCSFESSCKISRQACSLQIAAQVKALREWLITQRDIPPIIMQILL